LVQVRNGGREEVLWNEGWPESNPSGRRIENQRLELVIRNGALEVLENGVGVYASGRKVVAFGAAHAYLQMSSHSNYPPREVYFDNLKIVSA
jgi:hypothetical protein